MSSTSSATFESLYQQLTQSPSPILPPPLSTINKSTSHAISNLLLHPTLETILHLLNHDLPSAHFLVRHMQSPPAFEGMYLHAILHRIEGDYNNARAWYTDVSNSDIFKAVWGVDGKDRVMDLVERVERLRKEGVGSEEELEREGRREVESVTRFCTEKFGTERVEGRDVVEGVWVKEEEGGKVKEKKDQMLVGGEGWRQF